MPSRMNELPVFADVLEARQRLQGHAVVTPVIDSPKLNALTGGRVFIKAECLQRTGSFKFRGAWNCISRLGGHEAGVVAYSSGNHAQGVAAAAQMMGLPALIVMPADTPEIKKFNTRSYGAEIVTYDRATESREEIAQRICDQRGAVLVPPFEHKHIMAGQGTLALELVEQVSERGAALDCVLTPCSGGGLTAGIALALEGSSKETDLYAVEPAGFDDYGRSLRSGKRERNSSSSGSICDALLTAQPGEMTFAINQPRLAGAFAVDEAEVKRAIIFAFENLKLVIEPGGCVALAAVLAARIETQGKTIGIIASGGNVDAGLYASILAGR
ncbi:threonine/serine dehydratase [soil metagenome]